MMLPLRLWMMLIGATRATANGKYSKPTEKRETKENASSPIRPAQQANMRFLTNPTPTINAASRGTVATGTRSKLVPDCCVSMHGFPTEHDSDTEP